MQQNKQDLEYQPKQENYSFVNRRLKLKRRIKASLIVLGIFLLITIPLSSIFLLNYFRFIHLGNYSKVFESLPKSPYEVGDIIQNYKERQKERQSVVDFVSVGENSFSASGKIDKISENSIRLKLFSGKTITLELTPETQIAKRSKDGAERELMFTFELLQKENIDKNADTQFSKEGNKYILTGIEIIKNN